MSSAWKSRSDAWMPFQKWNPFPPEAIVQVSGYNRSDTKIGSAASFWWGWSDGLEAEGVIRYARRLDRPKC